MELEFWKYEGAGNDFIILDGRNPIPDLPGDIIRYLCDRHRGIGADGLMILGSTEGYDFSMRYYNADGGEVSMCGNGGRCITLFAEHLGIGGDSKTFIGKDGPHKARIISRSGISGTIEIGLIDVTTFEYRDKTFIINTGVPHYVEFVENTELVDVISRGRPIRYSENFVEMGGTNVNFVEVLGYGQIRVRTYERGVEDETLACGTGAAASAIATFLYSQNDCYAFTVHTPGGILEIRFNVDHNQHFTDISLTGPASKVFHGTVNVNY